MAKKAKKDAGGVIAYKIDFVVLTSPYLII